MQLQRAGRASPLWMSWAQRMAQAWVRLTCRFAVERVTGIEPALSAWDQSRPWAWTLVAQVRAGLKWPDGTGVVLG